MHTILLYGGGIDSSTLLHYLAHAPLHDARYADAKLEAMFFRYGQKAEKFEQQACEYFCKKYNVPLTLIDVPLGALSNSAIMSGSALANDPAINILDGRNITFLSLAGMYAAKVGATQIAMGYHVEPVARPFPDASIEFVGAFNAMIPFAFKHDFELVAPFANWTREEIFQYAKDHDSEILQLAHTCYEDVEGGCGKCTHCLLKQQIMGAW